MIIDTSCNDICRTMQELSHQFSFPRSLSVDESETDRGNALTLEDLKSQLIRVRAGRIALLENLVLSISVDDPLDGSWPTGSSRLMRDALFAHSCRLYVDRIRHLAKLMDARAGCIRERLETDFRECKTNVLFFT